MKPSCINPQKSFFHASYFKARNAWDPRAGDDCDNLTSLTFETKMKRCVLAWGGLFAPANVLDGCPGSRNSHKPQFSKVPDCPRGKHQRARMHTSGITPSEAKPTHTPPSSWDGATIETQHLISKVKFNEAGLVPAVAQQWDTGEVLMMAWMNAESIRETLLSGRAVYYSRSRSQLWRKGDTSGQIQVLRDVILDCDGDTILVKVDQLGVACHTGRRSCFYTAFRPPSGEANIIADVLMDPKELYKGDAK